MKAVILDGYTVNPGDLNWSTIQNIDKLTIYDRTDKKDIISRIKDCEIVITNKTEITRETIKACPSIKLITVLATGYDVIDIKAAKDYGVAVCNVPAYGSQSVAQFAIALLLELCNDVGHHSKAVYDGRWQNNKDWCFWDRPLIELAGKTMGIIGFGRIGQNTGKIAKALGMNIIACDSYHNPNIDFAKYVDLDTLLEKSDVVVLHCSLNEDNKNLINQNTLSKMKKNAFLINNARGGLINEKDLANALNQNVIAGAGLDVVSSEPIQSDNPLLFAKNCIITPHMSWGSIEARQRIMETTNENIQSFLNHENFNRIV